jgi:hypothetical protein
MEEEPIIIDNVFTEEIQIQEIYENSNPLGYVYDIIESFYQKSKGNLDVDSNMIMAVSEFHVNNLIFLKENFKTLPNSTLLKLLNLLNILLNLREDSTDEFSSREPDFAFICRKKLIEIKRGLYTLNLVYKKSKADNSDKFIYLKNEEIACLLEYIKTFYFPFIKLYYHFMNIEKITENKKIEVVINRPLPVPPLNMAMLQMQEKHQFDERKEDKDNELKNVMFIIIYIG